MIKKQQISSETIKRLAVYLRYLEKLYREGVKIISSSHISKILNIPSSQFRKDLSFFGEFGKRGVGYDIGKLIREIKKIIGIDEKIRVIIIGVGRLGSALIGYPGFSDLNIEISGAFDKSPEKVGKKIENIIIRNISGIGEFIKKEKIKVAVICVPANQAQNVCDILVENSIKGILNFAPVKLLANENISISNVDVASEICNLIYLLKNSYAKSQ
ncbi:MAG TPA: redox-sensing transcriptional repressor Rex [bacterium]|nr:redox-sensing transcriptional repressor Rex [bacterium]